MALEGGEGSVSPTGCSLSLGKTWVPLVQEAGWAPGLVWTGAENLVPTRIRSLDHPARSQSLYRLRYLAPLCYKLKVAGSIPNGVTVSLPASTLPLTEMSTMNIKWGVKVDSAQG